MQKAGVKETEKENIHSYERSENMSKTQMRKIIKMGKQGGKIKELIIDKEKKRKEKMR